MIYQKFMAPKSKRKPTVAEKKCLKPCRKMTNKVALTNEEYIEDPIAVLEFRFKEMVRVEKRVIV